MAFSPDGALLAAGADTVYDPRGQLGHGDGHGGNVDSLAFSSDGSLLAAGSDRRELAILGTADGSATRPIMDAYSPAVVDLSISRCG